MKYDFPKLDLHLHLDGSVIPEIVWELSKTRNVEVPGGSIEGYKKFLIDTCNCKDVNEYLKRFAQPLEVLQDKEGIIIATKGLVELLSSQGVRYAEIRFAPQLHTQKGLTQTDAIEAVLEGVNQADEPNTEIGVICCAMSLGEETINMSENLETMTAAKKYIGKGVVAVDLAGAEGIIPLNRFSPIFDLARELELSFTCHAGDSDGANTCWDALGFGTKRIGHGHRSYEDMDLCKELIKSKVTLEVCPTSNIQCHTQPSYSEHSLKKLFDMGVSVTINTDNMILADVNLDKEYDHCINEMGFGYNDLVTMNINSVKASFMNEDKKEKLIKELETYYR